MFSFSLDTNCVIAIADGRAESDAVRTLSNAHVAGIADVCLVAISASERQLEGGQLESFGEFQQRLNSLDLGHLPLLSPMFYWDITFWDVSLMSGDEPDDPMELLERRIHEILFPNMPFLWADYCAARDLDSTKSIEIDRKWRNAKCDVQALWSHIFHNRDVFVTSDKNFQSRDKKEKLLVLGAGRIETPLDARLLLPRALC